MNKIEEAHLKRKELAESSVFDQTLRTQLTERVIYENEMLKENFKDELTNHIKSNFGSIVSNEYKKEITEAVDTFSAILNSQNEFSAV